MTFSSGVINSRLYDGVCDHGARSEDGQDCSRCAMFEGRSCAVLDASGVRKMSGREAAWIRQADQWLAEEKIDCRPGMLQYSGY
jgi:acid phosphatase family membrane protein YuiD